MQCSQENCERDGSHLFTWPGYPATPICSEHLPKVQAIAAAMGIEVPVIAMVQPSACPVCDAAWPAIGIVAAGADGGADLKGMTVSVVLSIQCAVCKLTSGAVVSRTLSKDASRDDVAAELERAGVPR